MVILSSLADIAVITNELVLADLEVMEKRLAKVKSKKPSDPEAAFVKRALAWLEDGRPLNGMKHEPSDAAFAREYGLLSMKPRIFVLNVDDESVAQGNNYSRVVEEVYGESQTCRISASIEEQTAQFTRDEQIKFLDAYGITAPRTELLMRKVYSALCLQSFFTVGPQMAHGWAIERGATVREASGEIHSDFAENFVRARVLGCEQYMLCPNVAAAEARMDVVNDKYVMCDGDVLIVEHSAQKK